MKSCMLWEMRHEQILVGNIEIRENLSSILEMKWMGVIINDWKMYCSVIRIQNQSSQTGVQSLKAVPRLTLQMLKPYCALCITT